MVLFKKIIIGVHIYITHIFKHFKLCKVNQGLATLAFDMGNLTTIFY